jgi:hypothetical protein
MRSGDSAGKEESSRSTFSISTRINCYFALSIVACLFALFAFSVCIYVLVIVNGSIIVQRSKTRLQENSVSETALQSIPATSSSHSLEHLHQNNNNKNFIQTQDSLVDEVTEETETCNTICQISPDPCVWYACVRDDYGHESCISRPTKKEVPCTTPSRGRPGVCRHGICVAV